MKAQEYADEAHRQREREREMVFYESPGTAHGRLSARVIVRYGPNNAPVPVLQLCESDLNADRAVAFAKFILRTFCEE